MRCRAELLRSAVQWELADLLGREERLPALTLVRKVKKEDQGGKGARSEVRSKEVVTRSTMCLVWSDSRVSCLTVVCEEGEEGGELSVGVSIHEQGEELRSLPPDTPDPC